MYAHELRLLLAHLRALANPTRLRILELLAGEEMSVTDLAAELRMSQPRVSWHLALLRRGGAVRQRREGRQAICSLDWESVRQHQLMLWELLAQHKRIQSRSSGDPRAPGQREHNA
jgi:DNA-binding transcriptional ArsR family regulator